MKMNVKLDGTTVAHGISKKVTLGILRDLIQGNLLNKDDEVCFIITVDVV